MKFLRLHLPATNDSGDRAWFADGYSGETVQFAAYRALWEARYNRERLEGIFRVVHSYYRSAQYDQEPSMGDLAYFLMDNVLRDTHPVIDSWWWAADCANTETASGSETAFVAMGVSFSEGLIKVLGARAGRWRPEGMFDNAEAFYGDMVRLTGMHAEVGLIERASGGYGLADRMRTNYRIEEISPVGGKEDRASDVCFLVNQHKVAFPAQPSRHVVRLETQMKDFPLCSLKDLVDAAVHCLKFVQSNREIKPDSTVHESIVTYDTQAPSFGPRHGYEGCLNPPLQARTRQPPNWAGVGTCNATAACQPQETVPRGLLKMEYTKFRQFADPELSRQYSARSQCTTTRRGQCWRRPRAGSHAFP